MIGVHSAKFPSEQLTANIREAVMRHHIEHPVVNDAGFEVWQSYTVRAWPTVVLIDPLGNYVGSQPGEIQADDFIPIIERMIEEFDKQGTLDRRPLDPRPEAALEPVRPLSYPSKLLAADDGRLFVADTGHHRIVEARLDEGGTTAEIVRVFGNGEAALRDGPAAEASFNGPHGLALDGTTLYVADTDNHAIRAIDLDDGMVRTVAGTGEKAHGSVSMGAPTATPLRSPWAVLAEGGLVFIAMAGAHQIWALLNEERLGPFAGNGREALVDGPRGDASLNQPSDLAMGGYHIFVADAEASAIRAISFEPEGGVSTLVGQGLFDWGDVDGVGAEARLQHPTGIAYADGTLYIADSYNHKIKTLDPETSRVATLIGTGQAGHADGAFSAAELFEPEGIAASDGRLYIADTNNHLVRVADLEAKTVATLALRGLERLQPRRETAREGIRLAPITVAPGRVALAFDVELPPGYKLNPEAPVTLHEVGSAGFHRVEAGAAPALTVDVEADRDLVLDLTLYYCQAEDERLCMIHDARLILPLVVAADGPSEARVEYQF